MSRFHKNSSLAEVSLSLLMVLLFVSASSPVAFAQEHRSHHDWSVPSVYNVENTGAHYRTPDFPSFDRLPIIRPLPDPFRFAAGYRDTSFASWERRRNEIKASIEKYEIGPKPDCSDCTITATYTPAAAGSTAGALAVTVTRNGKSLTLNSRVWLPQGMGDGPFPVLIPMSLAFPPFFVPPVPNYGSLPASVFASRPVATIDFFHNDVTLYSFSGIKDSSTDPFYQLYPELCSGKCNGNVSTSGQYAAWSWGVSRLIDGIEIAAHQATNPLPIDVKHIAVTGCSYAGKMALFAGAFDERIGLTIAQENGGGGAPAWRVTDDIEAGNASEDIQRTDYNWFAGQMKQFSGVNRFKMPTDHHELMAMVAPRALLETGNTDFYWLSNRSNYVSARATQRVYDTLGIEDRFGFYIDSGHNHCATLPAEAPAIASFVDKFMLGDATANTDVEVNPYPTLDYKRWTAWWGGIPDHYPEFPNDWNPGDGTAVMGLNHSDRDGHFFGWPFGDWWNFGDNRRLWIGSGDTVQGSYQVAIGGHTHPDANVTLVNGNVQADVHCFDGTSYTLTIPFPANQSTAVPANRNNFFPSPANPASATASRCSGVLEGAYFQALGVNPGAVGNPGGPGFTTTDMDDPLETRFSCSANGRSTRSSAPLTVKFQP